MKQSSFRSTTFGLPYHQVATNEDYVTEACQMSILKPKKYQKFLWETMAYSAELVVHTKEEMEINWTICPGMGTRIHDKRSRTLVHLLRDFHW